jgi:DNA-binding NtrC family response regulator
MSPNPSRVLVIDSDAAILTLIVALLKRDGVSADAVSEPKAALEMLTAHRYDAVIVEPRYSGGDGLLAELMAAAPDGNANLIVVTSPDFASSVWATRNGVRAMLAKPFAVDDLRTAVRGCCQQPVEQ